MDSKNSKEISKSLIKRMELKDDAHLKKYIMWENKSNICWLDASMSLVAHNKVMKRYSEVNPECRISKIISAYDDAISILNSSDKNLIKIINLARGKLNNVQESTLQYLQPILKYKTGDPESAFCSLYNLLIQDAVMKRIFDVTWISIKECTDCGHYSENTKSKPVITLSKIDEFDPENPAVVYNCICKRSGQKMKLVYVSLPPCLIFHFENGAGKGKPPLSFITRGREYQLTGIMTLEKSQDSTVNHFITWVRDPSVNKWLDCNDLNLDITVFTPDFPDINFQDVYMYVYESFDDLGTITDSKIIKTKKSNENIPCIDLSEESDNENSNSQRTASEFNEHSGKTEVSDSDLNLSKNNNTSSTEPDGDKSVEASMSGDNKVTLQKNIPQASFKQNSKNTCDKTSVKETLENQSKQIGVSDEKVSSQIISENNGKLKTSSSVTINVNITSTDVNDGKEINENIDESNNRKDDIVKLNNENSCSFPRVKETLKESRISSIIEDWSENSKVDCKPSDVENEPSFHNKKEQNFSVPTSNLSKDIQNKELSPTNISSNTSDEKTGKPENLCRPKIRDLVLTKQNAKKNSKKEEMNDSEQLFTNSDAEQSNNERLALNPNVKQQIHSAHFLSDAAANSSGTSYVKVSVRRKKYPNLPLGKQNFINNTINQVSDERSYKMIDGPSFSKSSKRAREIKQEMDEDYDYVRSAMPNKKQRIEKISNVKKNEIVRNKKGKFLKAKTKVLKTRLKKSSQAKSKLDYLAKRICDDNSIVNMNKEEKNLESHHKLFPEQACSQLKTVSEEENSNMNLDKGGKILKDFEDMWSCHKSGCNCDSTGLEETIDIVVDYTFAYLCKLSQEFKKSNSH